MRGIRIIVAIGLLAGSAVGVAAQDDETANSPDSRVAAEVAGSSGHGQRYDRGRTVVGEGKASMLGEAWEVALSGMGDPRLHGTMRTVYNRDIFGLHGSVKSFASRIDNADGSWLGTGQGYGSADGNEWYFEALYTGEGAYDGLSALLFTLDQDGRFNYYGLVFPGEMPEMPLMPEPPAG